MAKSEKQSDAGPQVGDKVKDFSILGTGELNFKLSAHRGQSVVLYFYPKDSTPGCTLEGHEFTKLLPQFKKLNAVVYGISRDSLSSHEKFKEKQDYKFDLLSDQDEVACKIFDIVKPKNMYGKMVMGVERSTYIIDEKGKVAAIWRKVKAEGHAAEVLKTLKQLSKDPS